MGGRKIPRPLKPESQKTMSAPSENPAATSPEAAPNLAQLPAKADARSVRRQIKAKLGATNEPRWFQWLLIGLTFCYLFLLLFVPLITVFASALEKGVAGYFHTFADADTLFSIRLTLLIAAVAVPVNLTFGVAASWAIAKFDFPGRNILTTL